MLIDDVIASARPGRVSRLFAGLGLEPSIDQSAAYVEGWLTALKDDKKAIFRAASEAQKAVGFITARCGASLADEVASAA